jgi:anthranilate phosphoribosyltransferase
VENSAEIFLNILNGKGTTPQNNVVCANAGMAIATARSCSPREGFETAQEALRSGKALQVLKKLQELSR